MQIAIIIDSISCPTPEQKEQYQFEVVPINVFFEGKVYRDGIDLSASEAYRFLDKNPKDWATSAPSPGDFLAAYKKAAKKGAKEIICLTLSQKISATWNSARMAKETAKSALPDVKIEVIDTETAAGGTNLIFSAVAKAAAAGEKFDEIIKLTESLKKKVRVYILLDTIRYIYRSGRIPEIASRIGAILPLKPIVEIIDGKLRFEGAATSMQKSIDRILGILKENWDEKRPEICLTHADCPAELEKLKKKVEQFLPRAQIYTSEFSPIMGYATGRGSLLIAFFTK